MITDEIIINASMGDTGALAKGKKLAADGSFSLLMKNAESTVYWGDCQGSGKNPYKVSIVLGSGNPSPRCSCPAARHNPICKHSLALLTLMKDAESRFKTGELPEDLSAKLERKEANAQKKQELKKAALSGTAKPAKPKSVTATQKKKIEKQLEGLDMAQSLMDDLLSNGIATLSGKSASTFTDLAKELSGYLPGLQISFLRIADFVEKIGRESDKTKIDVLYGKSLQEIVRLNSIIKKARKFLSDTMENLKNDQSAFDSDDNYLYEALGGSWKLETLVQMGSFEENARLIQLSFDVQDDKVKREEIDRAFYFDLNTNEIFQTINMRPYKVRGKILQDDSFYKIKNIPIMSKYPGFGCRRIRWDDVNFSEVTTDDYSKVLAAKETDIPTALKKVKNSIKGTLAPKWLPVILPVGKIFFKEDSLVLADKGGNTILLSNYDMIYGGSDTSPIREPLCNVMNLPVEIKEDDCIFGLVFYDDEDDTFKFNPCSYINSENIIRLMF